MGCPGIICAGVCWSNDSRNMATCTSHKYWIIFHRQPFGDQGLLDLGDLARAGLLQDLSEGLFDFLVGFTSVDLAQCFLQRLLAPGDVIDELAHLCSLVYAQPIS